jgi:hypothetical protein
MPEDRLDAGGSLSELTTSEYLLLNSDKYKLTADSAVDASGRPLRGGLNLSPKDDYLPSARLQVDAGPDKRPSATLSLGTKLLNFQSRFQDVPPQQGGDALTNTVSGKAGPFGAFYSETSQTGNPNFEQTGYGGSLAVGPVQLYGQRNQSSQDVVDPSYAPYFQNTRSDQQTDTFGARGSLPVGQGMLSGDISRQLGAGRFPQRISQEARPTGQFPNVTRYSAGYEGRVGPGNLALQGNLTDVRGVGMEPSIGGSYTIPNPLGLGGQFRATGSYGNPLDPNRKSAAEAMMLYKLNF